MQIRKIRFENIHSLRGLHEVDFGSGILAEAGLFAITGPTGSGKSTLLDVITLALFNRIARVDKNISNTILEDDGGIMTRNMKSCFAEVEYRVNGRDYRCHWSIERNRNNNLNARKQELVDIQNDTIIESGTKTPTLNEEIIGLSYDQFVKAMVLAQGEFSKLLQADRSDRNKLLEDITGARSYREIGKAVYQRYSSIKREVERKEEGLKNIIVLTEEEIADKKTNLEALNVQKPKLQNTLRELSEKIKVRADLNAKRAEQAKLQENKETLRRFNNDFESDKNRLEKHEKLVKYRDVIREFDLVCKAFDETTTEITRHEKRIAENHTLRQNLHASASKLLNQPVVSEEVHEKLEAFRAKISELQLTEKERQNEANLYANQAKALVRKIREGGHAMRPIDHPRELKAEIDGLSERVKTQLHGNLAETTESLNAKSDELRKAAETASELLTKKKEELRLRKEIQTLRNRLASEKKEMAADREKIPVLQAEIARLEGEIHTLNKEVEHRRKHQSLEAHRAELNPGDPCPLCGSTDHPYASDQPVFEAKDDLLKNKQELVKVKSETKARLVQKTELIAETIMRIESDTEGLMKEEAANRSQLEKLAEALNLNPNAGADDLQQQKAQIGERQARLETLKKAIHLRSLLTETMESLIHWEESLHAYNEAKENRGKLYSGPDINKDVQNLSTQITLNASEIAAAENHLSALSEKLSVAKSRKSTEAENLTGILNAENLRSIDALREAILPEEKAKKIRDRAIQLKEGEARLNETEKNLNLALENLTRKDDSQRSDEELKTAFAEAETNWNQLAENIGKITQSLEDDEKTRQRQNAVRDQLEKLKKDQRLWKTMNELIGDATGNKFSNFVQDLTLEQLIGYANRRLMEFTDRYILDIPTAEEAIKSDTLKVFDKYLGNSRRSVRTLSGGETFLVSLAMAFALSDVASRNVKIESLFIDEGFGTLDPDTLDQAITILEKMQNEGDKSVGVISHVGALKERITTQIQLDKSSLGYSTIRIVQ